MHRYFILAMLVACTRPAPQLVPQVQPGPAQGAKPARVLVLQTNCGSLEFKCPKNYIATVDTIVRSTLEFSGLKVVNAEDLRLQTRQRHEEHETTETQTSSQSATHVERTLAPDDHITNESQSQSTTEKTTVVLDGPGFDDMTPAERDEVMAQAGADGVLVVRVVVGAMELGWTPNQNVEVMVRLAVNKGDTMAWASRCMASSNDFSTVTAALENAARCAVYGGTGR
jgi:hypothetical protein